MRTGLAVLACVGLMTIEAQAQPSHADSGRRFAQANCASCHAIGPVGDSPLQNAPPFRSLHLRYPVEDLAEGITTAHAAMPQFKLDVAQIEDLIAYLKSLER